MNKRQYYLDSYTRRFVSRVVEISDLGDQHTVVLESTYFYPTSGGQLHDTGRINNSNVVDVVVRTSDDAIQHLLDSPVDSDQVSAEIDWGRRFDHMQQHSGQHILSQSFLRELSAQTVSFHMGSKTCTLDLDIGQLNGDSAKLVEMVANQIVWENRQVNVRFVPREDADTLNPRKQPPGNSDRLRLVEIQDFDVSACGGTHVASTGEIGTIKIVKWERRKNMVRVEFVCGARALSDYRVKNRIVSNLSALYTTGYWELEDSIKRQIEETTSYRRKLRKVQKSLIKFQVADMLIDAGKVGDCILVVEVFSGRTLDEMRIMANQISNHPKAIALLGTVGDKAHLIFARHRDASGDMGKLIKDAFALLGSGSGGGSPVFGQGSASITDREEIARTLATIRKRLE